MKTIKLEKSNIKKFFDEEKLFYGKMISYSKSNYKKKYPFNKIFFNANIFIKENDIFEKIWYGDLDLNFDSIKLKRISQQLNTTLYILSEMSGRFENENTQKIEELNVWNTNEDIIKPLSKKFIKFLKKEQKIKNKYSLKIMKIKNDFEKFKNKKLPIKSIDNQFNLKIKIDYNLFEKEKEILFKKIINLRKNNLKITKNIKTEELYNQHGYFSAYVLDKFLKEKLSLNNINPINIWLSNKTNKKLRKIDLKIEQYLNNSFCKKDFQREVTCNYCIFDFKYLNDKEINDNSLTLDYLYIKGYNYK